MRKSLEHQDDSEIIADDTGRISRYCFHVKKRNEKTYPNPKVNKADERGRAIDIEFTHLQNSGGGKATLPRLIETPDKGPPVDKFDKLEDNS